MIQSTPPQSLTLNPASYESSPILDSLKSLTSSTFSGLGDAVTLTQEPPSSTSSSPETSSTFTIKVSLIAKENSWSRSARRGNYKPVAPPYGQGLSWKIDLYEGGGGKAPGTLLHNINADEGYEKPRDEHHLIVADFFVTIEPNQEVEGQLTREGQVVVSLEGHWVKGYDSRKSGEAWESLWGTLRRKFKEAVEKQQQK